MLSRLKQSLIQRVFLLFGAVTLLLIVEVVLGVRISNDNEAKTAAITTTYRRAQSLIIAAANINDFIFDLSFRDRTDMGLPETLAHWHTHLVKMIPIVIAARGVGHDLTGPSLDELITRSAQIQHSASASAVDTLAHDALTLSEILANEVLGLLVGLESVRLEQSAHGEATQRHYTWMMFAVGIGMTLIITIASWRFLINLSRGLHSLNEKAELIAGGKDIGPPLLVEREDELGAVMHTVNIMAERLFDRDQQLAELRVRFGHQEKMMALGTFAAGMAHEIGNPIQAITALCYHLQEQVRETLGDAQQRELLPIIDTLASNAERLVRTVAEVREFAYPNRVEKEAVDLNELVQKTVALMSYDPRLKHHIIEVQCLADNPVVDAVPDHLVQVLLNLLINAADAMEGRVGNISVTTENFPQGVVVAVADAGIGMTPEVLRRAFEPFFTTKPHNRGTGLGLAICRAITAEQNVAMDVTSQPDVGTTVRLKIPRG